MSTITATSLKSDNSKHQLSDTGTNFVIAVLWCLISSADVIYPPMQHPMATWCSAIQPPDGAASASDCPGWIRLWVWLQGFYCSLCP